MAIQSANGLNQAYSKVSQIENATPQNKLLDNQARQTEKFSLDGSNASSQAPGQDKPLTKEQQKVEQQANLIEHLFGKGAPKESNALKILFQETIEKLNEVLAPDLGPNAISAEKLAEQGGMDYWSPENTAGRIVQGTTGFFESYKAANPGLEGEALLDKFLSVIGGGIESGFKDATNILQGFGVYQDSIKDNAEKTYDLVQQGLAAFREQQMEKMGLSSPAGTGKDALTQTTESD
ncbi:DUF5610 domain-containing protein [Thiomicrospira sp.]|uniref:DUF5610 domain-containing protein n=1 Tax=Thiomicrospira sp. TaxID=935 RepID=UPI002F92DB21